MLNLEYFDPYDEDFMKITVLDYSKIHGAFIDRQMNKDYGMTLKKSKHNLEFYKESMGQEPPYFPWNLQL